MRENFKKLYGNLYGENKHQNLNLGSGGDIDPDFVNLDWNDEQGADFVWDLEKTPLPFQDGQFKLIVASHVLEHIRNYIALMDDLYRVLRGDGRVIIYVPYYTSQDAWASPEHVRSFSEESWAYLNQKTYRNPGAGNYKSAVRCNFEIEQIILCPQDKYRKEKDLMELMHTHWNIVKEMNVTLRKEPHD